MGSFRIFWELAFGSWPCGIGFVSYILAVGCWLLAVGLGEIGFVSRIWVVGLGEIGFVSHNSGWSRVEIGFVLHIWVVERQIGFVSRNCEQ